MATYLGREGVSSEEGGEEVQRTLPDVTTLIFHPPHYQFQDILLAPQRNDLRAHTQ